MPRIIGNCSSTDPGGWSNRKLSLFCAASLAILVVLSSMSPGLSADTDWSLAEKAVAVLERNCGSCHGETKASGLDIRRRETLLKGGARGAAVIPGNADGSLLYRAAAHQGELKMPPGSQSPLPSAELNVLKRWI